MLLGDHSTITDVSLILFSLQYLARNGICDITRDNFSFSAKIKVGDFYEAREGPEVTNLGVAVYWILFSSPVY